jgi:hypothetical protein
VHRSGEVCLICSAGHRHASLRAGMGLDLDRTTGVGTHGSSAGQWRRLRCGGERKYELQIAIFGQIR